MENNNNKRLKTNDPNDANDQKGINPQFLQQYLYLQQQQQQQHQNQFQTQQQQQIQQLQQQFLMQQQQRQNPQVNPLSTAQLPTQLQLFMQQLNSAQLPLQSQGQSIPQPQNVANTARPTEQPNKPPELNFPKSSKPNIPPNPLSSFTNTNSVPQVPSTPAIPDLQSLIMNFQRQNNILQQQLQAQLAQQNQQLPQQNLQQQQQQPSLLNLANATNQGNLLNLLGLPNSVVPQIGGAPVAGPPLSLPPAITPTQTLQNNLQSALTHAGITNLAGFGALQGATAAAAAVGGEGIKVNLDIKQSMMNADYLTTLYATLMSGLTGLSADLLKTKIVSAILNVSKQTQENNNKKRARENATESTAKTPSTTNPVSIPTPNTINPSNVHSNGTMKPLSGGAPVTNPASNTDPSTSSLNAQVTQLQQQLFEQLRQLQNHLGGSHNNNSAANQSKLLTVTNMMTNQMAPSTNPTSATKTTTNTLINKTSTQQQLIDQARLNPLASTSSSSMITPPTMNHSNNTTNNSSHNNSHNNYYNRSESNDESLKSTSNSSTNYYSRNNNNNNTNINHASTVINNSTNNNVSGSRIGKMNLVPPPPPPDFAERLSQSGLAVFDSILQDGKGSKKHPGEDMGDDDEGSGEEGLVGGGDTDDEGGSLSRPTSTGGGGSGVLTIGGGTVSNPPFALNRLPRTKKVSFYAWDGLLIETLRNFDTPNIVAVPTPVEYLQFFQNRQILNEYEYRIIEQILLSTPHDIDKIVESFQHYAYMHNKKNDFAYKLAYGWDYLKEQLKNGRTQMLNTIYWSCFVIFLYYHSNYAKYKMSFEEFHEKYLTYDTTSTPSTNTGAITIGGTPINTLKKTSITPDQKEQNTTEEVPGTNTTTTAGTTDYDRSREEGVTYGAYHYVPSVLFSGLDELEIRRLIQFRNVLSVAFTIIPPQRNEVLLLKIAAVFERSGHKYQISKSGQTMITTRRRYIFKQESNYYERNRHLFK